MNKFASVLKKVNERIDLPQPLKSRILLEISADLNDLYELCLQQGYSEKEAMIYAEKKCNLDDKTIADLVNVYNTGIYKWLHNISDRTRNKWEKLSIVFIILFSIVFTGQVILTTKFFMQTSIYVLPVVGLATIAIILIMIKYYKIYFLKDHNINRLRENLPTILFLGGASLLVGVIGFFIDLYLTVSKIASDMKNTLIYFMDWLIRSSSYLMICLVTVIFLFFLWYIIYTKVTKIEFQAIEHLIST
jgi:hypothetical protein